MKNEQKKTMKLPTNISVIKALPRASTSYGNSNWETLLVQTENESPDALYNLKPRRKYILKRFYCQSSTHAERLWTSLRFLSGLSHPNIVIYHGSVICHDECAASIIVACELCLKGSLFDLMTSEREIFKETGKRLTTVSQKFSLLVFLQICHGLVYLHDTMQTFHGNIRPSNILIDADGVCRLTDIGLRISAAISAEASSDPLTDLRLTNYLSEYSPPEYYACDLRTPRQICSGAGDMFATGCVLIELLTGTFIHERSKRFGVEVDQVKLALEEVANLHSQDSQAWKLSSALLEKNPIDRPSASKALFLSNRRTAPRSVVASLTVDPFVVPRSNAQDSERVISNSLVLKDEDDILSFFQNTWGQSGLNHSGDAPWPDRPGKKENVNGETDRAATLLCNAILKGAKRSPRSAPNSARGTEPLPKSVLRAKNAISSTDQESLMRKQALSMRLCADALELQKSGKLDAAESKFKTALAASPLAVPANVLFEYGNFLLLRRQDITGAEAMWERSIEQDSKHIPSLYALAKLKANFREEVGSAEELLRRVIGLDPRHAEALRGYGILLAMRGRDSLSESALKSSLLADPHAVETMVAYGWLLHRRGRIDEAENLYLRALSRDEGNHKALSLLALLHHDMAPPAWSEVQCCAPPSQMASDADNRDSSLDPIESAPYCTPRTLETRSLAAMYLQARKPTIPTLQHQERDRLMGQVNGLDYASMAGGGRGAIPMPAAASCAVDRAEAPPSPPPVLLERQDMARLTGADKEDHAETLEPPTPPYDDEDSSCSGDGATPGLGVRVARHRACSLGRHTEYCVECVAGEYAWHVWRRFSDFHRLHAQVPRPRRRAPMTASCRPLRVHVMFGISEWASH